MWFRPGCTLGYDGDLFWLQAGDTVHLKLFNTVESEKIYHACAIPEVVRWDGVTANLQEMMNAMWQYDRHAKLQQPNTQQGPTPKQAETSLVAELDDEVASFKAYSNRIVQAKFRDRTYVTLCSGTFRIVTKDGETFKVASTDPEFKPYIRSVLGFAEEVFHQEEKLWREAAQSQLMERLRQNDIALSISKGRPVQSRIVCGPPEFSAEQTLERNRQLLQRLRQHDQTQ